MPETPPAPSTSGRVPQRSSRAASHRPGRRPFRLPRFDFSRPGRVWIGVVVDAVLAGILLFITRGLDATYVYAPPSFLGNVSPPHWMSVVHTVWVVAAWAVISARRIWPRTVTIALPVLLAVHLAVLPTGYAAFVVTAFAMYHLGRYAPRRWFVPVWVAVVAGTVAALMLKGDYLVVDPVIGLFLSPVSFAVLGFFWMLGLNGRRRDRELMALRDRAELAAIAERTRIAREMHDIVAHSLTAVIAQADGGRYIAAKHPDKAVEALENIASTARSSLGQMRQLLSVLRDPDDSSGVPPSPPGTPSAPGAPSVPGAAGHVPADAASSSASSSDSSSGHASSTRAAGTAEFAPMPGLDALPQLVAEATRSGLRVTYTENGRRPDVGATMQLTIYRIIQESLTNALKHARPVAADVRLDWGKRGGTVTVRNDAGGGKPIEPPSESEGGERIGRGITGMRERVALHGGTLDIDDAPDGFTVTAHLPKE